MSRAPVLVLIGISELPLDGIEAIGPFRYITTSFGSVGSPSIVTFREESRVDPLRRCNIPGRLQTPLNLITCYNFNRTRTAWNNAPSLRYNQDRSLLPATLALRSRR